MKRTPGRRPARTERPSEKTLLRLAAVVRDSNDAVILRDLSERVVAWNKGAQRMYGYSEAEALGMSFRRLLPAGASPEPAAVADTVPTELQRRAKDGRTLDVLVTVTILRDAAGRAAEIATTERDITDLKLATRELRRLHARVISAQETERKRLARELHDGVGQILSGVKYRLQALPGLMSLSGGAETKLLKVGGFLDHAIAEIRRVSQNLMPSELEDLGLEAALQTLCREFKERSGIAMSARTVHAAVEPDVALALFRIAQEALNNIGKHSKAAKVSVDLAIEGKELLLNVSDDGVGFAAGPRRRLPGRGIGLENMRQRAEAVGGSLRALSSPGKGTELAVRVPLTERGGGA